MCTLVGGGGSCPQRASLSTGIVCTLVGGGGSCPQRASLSTGIVCTLVGGGGVVHKEHPYQQV